MRYDNIIDLAKFAFVFFPRVKLGNMNVRKKKKKINPGCISISKNHWLFGMFYGILNGAQ